MVKREFSEYRVHFKTLTCHSSTRKKPRKLAGYLPILITCMFILHFNIKPNRSIRISILPGVWTTSLDIADVVHIPAVIEPGNTLGLCGTTRFSGFGPSNILVIVPGLHHDFTVSEIFRTYLGYVSTFIRIWTTH